MSRPNPFKNLSNSRYSKMPTKENLSFMGIGIVLMLVLYVIFPNLFVKDIAAPELADKAPFNEEVMVEALSKEELGLSVKPARIGAQHNHPLFSELYPYDSGATDELKVTIPSHEESFYTAPAFERPEKRNSIASKLKPKKTFKYALKNPSSKKARIAIIIDDVGMNRAQSRAAIEIDNAPLTLAFLPYAPDIESLSIPALRNGHELLLHMPMEAMSSKVPLGPIAIKDDMTAEQIEQMLETAYGSFDGYVGLNNHMGSRATQNHAAMKVVMQSLKDKGLFYVDSKTISSSIAADVAQQEGLPFAERDVFLDHEDALAFSRGALKRLEKVALEKGAAIAIGHPKANTLTALREWIPTLEARGFEIVPVSQVLMTPQAGDVRIASKPRKKKVQQAAKKPAILEEIKPAAGAVQAISDVNQEIVSEPVVSIAAEDLLSAPIGASGEVKPSLYSLSE